MWTLLGAMVLGAGCTRSEATVDPEAHVKEILQWREDRLAALLSPWGYLNLVGLYWLESPSVRIGSGPENDIVFPDKAAAQVGELEITDEGVTLIVTPDIDVRNEGAPVRSILISDDTTDNPIALTHGSLAWTVIKRDGRFALRLRDFEHPSLTNFAPLDYFPIDPALRVTATLQPYDEPRVVNVNTTIEGLGYRPESPGKLAFEINGSQYELEAYASGDKLFFVFGDATSGRETYPAGRFVYTDRPDVDGKTVLDFNKSYNPPCAFNAFATCPVASPRNRLKTRILAGEIYDPTVHKVPDGYH